MKKKPSASHTAIPRTEVQLLETQLGRLAMRWRAVGTPELQAEIAREYHAAVRRLYELGWDDVIGVDSQLPEESMPSEYLERHPLFYGPIV